MVDNAAVAKLAEAVRDQTEAIEQGCREVHQHTNAMREHTGEVWPLREEEAINGTGDGRRIHNSFSPDSSLSQQHIQCGGAPWIILAGQDSFEQFLFYKNRG